MRAPIIVSAGLCALFATPLDAQIGIKIQNTAASTTGQYIRVKYDKSLVPQTGITLEAWFTYDESNLGPSWRWPTIVRLNPNAGREAYWLRVDSGTGKNRSLAFGITTSVGLTRVSYRFAAGEFKNKWTHVAATYDGSVNRIYINGVLKVTSTQRLGPNLRDQGGTMNIGNGDGNVIENWNGEIDEVRLWPYARTAAEIQSTMGLHLNSVPGQVSTWNLDFSPRDSSGGNHGTDVNKPTYQVNQNKLAAGKLGVTVFGAGTAGCAGTPIAGASGRAKAGNKGFAVTCLNAARAAGSAGFLWIGVGRLKNSVPVSGAALWVNPAQPGLLVPVLGDRNRLIKVVTGIPNGTAVGTEVFCQFFFGEKGCAVPILSSEGLAIKTQ